MYHETNRQYIFPKRLMHIAVFFKLVWKNSKVVNALLIIVLSYTVVIPLHKTQLTFVVK